jgi:hypothetical protein
MKTNIGMGFALVILAASVPWIQPASALRCGTKLISEGDTQPRVRELCGEPTHVESWQEERIFRYYYTPYGDDRRYDPYSKSDREPRFVKEWVTIERWTYNLGSYRFVRYLVFENGVLTDITTGEHGY